MFNRSEPVQCSQLCRSGGLVSPFYPGAELPLFSSTFPVTFDKLFIFMDIPGSSPALHFRSCVFNNIPGSTFIFAITFLLFDSLQQELRTRLISNTWFL